MKIGNWKAIKPHPIPYTQKKFLLSWEDFQKEFGKTLGLSDKVSLKNAVMYADIDVSGHYHNALYDAEYTASLFSMIHDKDMSTSLKKVIDVLNPRPLKTSLGDLFDFQSLAVSL